MSRAARLRPAAAPSAAEDERGTLERLRSGDRAAFAAVVERHGPALLRLATMFLKDHSAAEEVVQEVWLTALAGVDGFEGRSSLRTWLLSIAANRARTRFVRERRSVPFSALGPAEGGPAVGPETFDQDGEWRAPPARWSEEDPERLAQDAELRVIIERAIADLPEAQRVVITLRDLEQLETEEICRVLGLGAAHLRVILHRARVRVRQALETHLAGTR